MSLILFAIPQYVYGLAGWSEESHDLYYTKDILIYFGNPSDTCLSRRCFYIYRADNRYGLDYFKNFDRLIAINAPINNQPSYVLGQSFEDGQWIIYDIKKDEEIFHYQYFERAVDEWKKLGYEEPRIIEMDDLLDQFEETLESKRNNRELISFFIIVDIMIVLSFLMTAGFIFIFFSRACKRRKVNFVLSALKKSKFLSRRKASRIIARLKRVGK